MNKFFKGALAVGIGCTMLATTALTACGGQQLDPETRPLMLSTGALDDNFNPFFYSSLNDGEMVSMTQISMLTIDGDGEIACGDDWPTVVQDYNMTMYDTKQVGTGNPVTNGNENGRTEYEFLIKNGIKFSDGTPLTIKDVLFNLYVYLDYAYTGSSTMYSTDIQGLKAYRTQDPSLNDDSNTQFGATFRANAQQRITNLKNWSQRKTETYDANDLKTVQDLFLEEIESDWNTLSTSWKETYKHAYSFDEVWQAYLYQEGIIEVQEKIGSNGAMVQIFNDKNNNGKRDDDEKDPAQSEKYYTTIDPDMTNPNNPGVIRDQRLIDSAMDAVTPDKIAQYKIDNAEEGVTITDQMAKEGLWKEFCIDRVYTTYTARSEIANVLTYWATASKVLEEFTGEESTKYFQTHKGVDSISGVTYKTDVSSFKGKELGEEHSVLKIVINGIDPKAIFNFAFTVAPLHYYSGTWTNPETGVTKNYVEEFDGVKNFGVEVGNSKFFSQCLGSPEKNALPIGAGAYKATNLNGDDNITGGFKTGDNILRFKRNEHFESTGKNINNAKIKFVNFKVYNDDQIMEALTTGEIDYGMPNASLTNNNIVSQHQDKLTGVSYRTGGYGYVGINPKFIPEYKVRQAIMKSMNTSIAIDMYGPSLAEPINRPVSATSWAYPQGVGEYESIAYTTNIDEIKKLVTDSGYEIQGGVLTKVRNAQGMSNAAIGTKLDLKFTIAGESALEHPSYRMFLDSQEVLNSIGFKITVSADPQALKQLSSGNLAVWAAAWSSSVDPDMYQIYHKDSKASNVNNWNYPNILNDTSTWRYEYDVITELSENIDQARKVMEKGDRIPYYHECLDLVMDLAVEFPVYQRNDLCVYNKNVINGNTLVSGKTPKGEDLPNHNMGLFSKIWEINYV